MDKKQRKSLFSVRMTLLQLFLHSSSKLFSASENRELFSESYFEALSERREKAWRRAAQLMIFSTTINAILFLQALGIDFTSNVMGLNVKSVTKNKELLLLLATIVGTVSAYFAIYSDFLAQLIKAGLSAQYPPAIARVYGLRFEGVVESLSRSAHINPDYVGSKSQNIFVGLTVLGGAVQALAFSFIGLALGVFVWLNAWKLPALDLGWNRAVLIVIAVNSLFLVLLMAMFRWKKLRFIDVRKVKELETPP